MNKTTAAAPKTRPSRSKAAVAARKAVKAQGSPVTMKAAGLDKAKAEIKRRDLAIERLKATYQQDTSDLRARLTELDAQYVSAQDLLATTTDSANRPADRARTAEAKMDELNNELVDKAIVLSFKHVASAIEPKPDGFDWRAQQRSLPRAGKRRGSSRRPTHD